VKILKEEILDEEAMRDWFITKLNDRLEFNEEKLKKVRKR